MSASSVLTGRPSEISIVASGRDFVTCGARGGFFHTLATIPCEKPERSGAILDTLRAPFGQPGRGHVTPEENAY